MDERARIINGDCLNVLATLPVESVNCCVTSPPYLGLRQYLSDDHPDKAAEIGLEETPEAYVARLVEVFREVRRVLKDDGTLWLNLGDTYASPPVGRFNGGGFKDQSARTGGRDLSGVATSGAIDKLKGSGLKQKDLVGIPWRVAFALQADGYYLRSEIIWHKPNPMPSSVLDRPTPSHEQIFLLSKSPRYYYDTDAIRVPYAGTTIDRYKYAAGGSASSTATDNPAVGGAIPHMMGPNPKGRNRRDVWTVPTARTRNGLHFATFPPDLIRPCILAGCPVGGTVLDPFAGAGTTGLVALEEGRNFLGIELNPDYCKMAEKRIVGLATVRPLSTFFEGDADERQVNEA